jgi:glyoxylase-like metal-dependent hydrolase (beta-lactamase superfamily II)
MQTAPMGQSGEAISEVDARTSCASILANVIVFEMVEGLVLVDAGLRNCFGSIRWLCTVVFTHGHVDHTFGLN